MEFENLEAMALRAEMIGLLSQQLKALDSPDGLTDSVLMECYDRQARVQELREKLQSLDQQQAESSEESKPSNLVMMPPVTSRRGEQEFKVTG